MPFVPGKSGNPRGRGKGSVSGRTATVAAMDRMLKRAKNMEMFEDEMEAEFRKDVMKFFKDYIMPLLPKEAKIEVASDGIVMWRNLLGKDVRAEDVGGGKKTSGQ